MYSVLRCLPDLRVLMLNVGTNFSPEHLEEMFEEPRLGIKRMEMRFRPYVEQATYYQFLKGRLASCEYRKRLSVRILLRHRDRDTVSTLASRSILHTLFDRPGSSTPTHCASYGYTESCYDGCQ